MREREICDEGGPTTEPRSRLPSGDQLGQLGAVPAPCAIADYHQTRGSSSRDHASSPSGATSSTSQPGSACAAGTALVTNLALVHLQSDAACGAPAMSLKVRQLLRVGFVPTDSNEGAEEDDRYHPLPEEGYVQMIRKSKSPSVRIGARRGLKLMPKKLLVGLAPLLAVAAFAVAPSTAMANVHTYCFQSLSSGAACPPNGSSKWWHIEENVAHDPYGSHYTCVDDYLNPNGTGYYTSQKCSYSYAEDWPGYVWGYPRAWNGEGATHTVEATEDGS
jgi:hypothetical protein